MVHEERDTATVRFTREGVETNRVSGAQGEFGSGCTRLRFVCDRSRGGEGRHKGSSGCPAGNGWRVLPACDEPGSDDLSYGRCGTGAGTKASRTTRSTCSLFPS